MINICRMEFAVMRGQYTIYSDFNIEKHKKTFNHYLKVVIDENGKIMYAVPSHQEKLISLACKKLNTTKEKLIDMCPPEYYLNQEYYWDFNFIIWLCKVSGACAVWDKFIEADKLTEQQIMALKMY